MLPPGEVNIHSALSLHALKSLSNLASFLHLVSFHDLLVHQYFTMMSPLRLPWQHETALSG